jgi:hypothetical protein
MRQGEGELVLTREITEVARVNKAQAVILGSYGVSGSSVYVNMKIVQPGSNYVLAAYDFVLPNEQRNPQHAESRQQVALVGVRIAGLVRWH